MSKYPIKYCPGCGGNKLTVKEIAFESSYELKVPSQYHLQCVECNWQGTLNPEEKYVD